MKTIYTGFKDSGLVYEDYLYMLQGFWTGL